MGEAPEHLGPCFETSMQPLRVRLGVCVASIPQLGGPRACCSLHTAVTPVISTLEDLPSNTPLWEGRPSSLMPTGADSAVVPRTLGHTACHSHGPLVMGIS